MTAEKNKVLKKYIKRLKRPKLRLVGEKSKILHDNYRHELGDPF